MNKYILSLTLSTFLCTFTDFSFAAAYDEDELSSTSGGGGGGGGGGSPRKRDHAAFENDSDSGAPNAKRRKGNDGAVIEDLIEETAEFKALVESITKRTKQRRGDSYSPEVMAGLLILSAQKDVIGISFRRLSDETRINYSSLMANIIFRFKELFVPSRFTQVQLEALLLTTRERLSARAGLHAVKKRAAIEEAKRTAKKAAAAKRAEEQKKAEQVRKEERAAIEEAKKEAKRAEVQARAEARRAAKAEAKRAEAEARRAERGEKVEEARKRRKKKQLNNLSQEELEALRREQEAMFEKAREEQATLAISKEPDSGPMDVDPPSSEGDE